MVAASAEPDDVTRLFRRLVSNIAALDPSRLDRPFPVSEIARSLVPYRTHRGVLKFETSEDYDMAVLRLLAGVGAYAVVEPEEARAALAAEAASSNPDTAKYTRIPGAMVRLDPEKVAIALAEAPPAPAVQPPVPLRPSGSGDQIADGESDDDIDTTSTTEHQLPFTLDDDASEDEPPATQPRTAGPGAGCPYCGGELPVGRAVLFCPHCGQNIGVVHCPTCGSELDVGWRFCITCGQKVAGVGGIGG